VDYNKITNIDESHLEREWVGQADRYMEVVQAEADAVRLVDQLKEKLEVTEALVGKSTREARAAAGTKCTEKEIADLLVLDKGVASVKAELRQAEYDALIVKGARVAMEHRRAALENLVKLQLRYSGSEPKLPEVPKREVETTMANRRREEHPTRLPVRKGQKGPPPNTAPGW